VDHYRRAVRTRAREQALEQIAKSASASWDEPVHDDTLATLLAPLPESQREVIEMLKVAGMSLEEVARATSTSVGSVKQKVHRAYKKLRERMIALGLKKRESGELS
jgi:RNA polymerase sigma-70 factor (ECF subfamily)